MKFALLSIFAMLFLLPGCENKKEKEQTDVDTVEDFDIPDISDESDEPDELDESEDLDSVDETDDTDTIDENISDETIDENDDSVVPDDDTVVSDDDTVLTDDDATVFDDDTVAPDDDIVVPDDDTAEISDDSEIIPDDDTVFDPCASDPCASIGNSDGICTVDGTDFICGCSGGYHFNKTEIRCLQTLQIGWCNTQYPVDLTNADSVIYGSSVSFYTQFYIDGITAATMITNATHTSSPAYPQIIAQLGTGSSSTDASGWMNWSVSAIPNEDKGNNDEYALLDFPVNLTPGNYDFIIRISGDSGNSWKYCNANRLAGSGYNGTDSVNLYDPAKNGHITVIDPPE